MNPVHKSVVIIGGGPAGLASAIRLYEKGIKDIVILEREHHPGGILRQCIHDGFGLTRFKETLSGPEYASRFVDQAKKLGIEILVIFAFSKFPVSLFYVFILYLFISCCILLYLSLFSL